VDRALDPLVRSGASFPHRLMFTRHLKPDLSEYVPPISVYKRLIVHDGDRKYSAIEAFAPGPKRTGEWPDSALLPLRVTPLLAGTPTLPSPPNGWSISELIGVRDAIA
jgi:hypothetical protein